MTRQDLLDIVRALPEEVVIDDFIADLKFRAKVDERIADADKGGYDIPRRGYRSSAQMAPRVVIRWVSKALNDLTDAFNYVGQRDPQYADALAKEIESEVNALLDNPYRGRKVPEYDRESLRELIVRRYRILYRVAPERIEVLGIFSDRNQLPRNL